jgi:hypothetical protein
VKRATGGAQEPWVSSSPIDGSFYFAGAPASAPSDGPIRRDDGPAVPARQEARLTDPGAVPDVVTECDRQAANPAAQRPKEVGGVKLGEIQTEPLGLEADPTARFRHWARAKSGRVAAISLWCFTC